MHNGINGVNTVYMPVYIPPYTLYTPCTHHAHPVHTSVKHAPLHTAGSERCLMSHCVSELQNGRSQNSAILVCPISKTTSLCQANQFLCYETLIKSGPRKHDSRLSAAYPPFSPGAA